uniref:Protein kinase domain-containing protein n=1 Tax=Steinernema glaseri TaxID=37863 RepID=A0A1I8AF57_9BILA
MKRTQSSSSRSKIADLSPPVSHFSADNGVVYHLERVIGKGGYGMVYSCMTDTGVRCALKTAKSYSLVIEAEVLKAVNKKNCRHFCRLLDEGFSATMNDHYIVMEIMGPSFVDLRNMLPAKKFSLHTGLRVSMQMLNAIEELHTCGFISRDVKPSNFVVGLDFPRCRMVHMIDFGISKKIVDARGELLKRRSHGGWRGTGRYCSLANHMKKDQCRRDDVESWFYVASEVMRGKLPWVNISKTDRDLLFAAKKSIRGINRQEFFKKLPGFMYDILVIIDNCDYSTTPDYQKIYAMFDEEMKNQKLDYKADYDWEECPFFVAMKGRSSTKTDDTSGTMYAVAPSSATIPMTDFE